MIIITGAAGFIGSCIAAALNEIGEENLILVDDFSRKEKEGNIVGKKYNQLVEREIFFDWLQAEKPTIRFVLHMGARTDTMELDEALFEHLNLDYSKKLWRYCVAQNIPLIYASSAATYGDGKLGFEDNPENFSNLKPMNPYGWSKQNFDLWAVAQKEQPPYWIGLKFFNVFGPNEYHKGRMASVVFHAFNQIQSTQKMKLFRSHRADVKDGFQRRDFIYIKEVSACILNLMKINAHSGIYNLGTARARTFLDLVHAVFSAMNLPADIEFIDTPISIRESYQYFTQADMGRMKKMNVLPHFQDLEKSVEDYVKNYLQSSLYY